VWWTRCPTCGAPTEPVKLAGFRRLAQLTAHYLLFNDLATERPANTDPDRRRCPTCGLVPIKPLKHGPHECQACGYDLAGTHGEHCPECGWALPPAMREYLEHKAYGPAHGSVR